MTHQRVFLEPTLLAAAQEVLLAILAIDGAELLTLRAEWPLMVVDAGRP